MVKFYTLLQTALNHSQTLLKRVFASFESLLSPQEQKIVKNIENNKKKYIRKKSLRSFIKEKLRNKKRNSIKALSHPSQYRLQKQENQNENEILHPSNELVSHISGKFTNFLKENNQELICSVCRSIVLLPAVTECDHIFCLQCIENSIILSNKCPLCRGSIGGDQNYGVRQLKSIENIINLKNTIKQEDEQHRTRIQQHLSWRKNRFVDVNSLSIGGKIDVWKIDVRQWKIAGIISIERDEENSITEISIAYDYLPKDQNQVIELPSLRIAAQKFYSPKFGNEDFLSNQMHFGNSMRISTQFEFLPPFPRAFSSRNYMTNIFNRPLNPPNRPVHRLGITDGRQMIGRTGIDGNLVFRTIPPRLRSPESSEGNTQLQQQQLNTNSNNRSNSMRSSQSDQFNLFLSPQENQILPTRENQPELFNLEILIPEEIQAPQPTHQELSHLLPNLNPQSQFLRQALSSSSQESSLDDVL